MSDKPLPSPTQLPSSAQKVQDHLQSLGLVAQVVELTDAARTSEQAAQALGVTVGQIAKSLVFSRPVSDSTTPAGVLVIMSGDLRVDTAKVTALLGHQIERATPAFVREQSGYAIGGVPPLAHAKAMTVIVDPSLKRFDQVWAAGGTPHCIFGIDPQGLINAVTRDAAARSVQSYVHDVAAV